MAAGLVTCLATFLFLRGSASPLFAKALALVAATATAMIAVDFALFRWDRTPESGQSLVRNPWSIGRIVRKCIGLVATLGALAAAYETFPEYAGDFYNPVWEAARACLPAFLVVAPLYIVYVDRIQHDPEDVYARLGLFLTGAGPSDWPLFRQHARGWLVKGFFLPLMFVYLTDGLGHLWSTDFHSLTLNFKSFFDFSYSVFFLVDLLFAVVGYLLTLRLLNNQIRSVEPTMVGWVVCLMCYQPFWSLFQRGYFAYETDQYYWGDLTLGHPVLYVVWGMAILSLLLIYTWSTVVFGTRFSNLTNRGIITSGPYRFTKHPAYISKCVSFWLISIPFLSNQGTEAALSQTIMLAGANLIYVARALTEERHLSRDPTYRDYQKYIRDRGLVARALAFASKLGSSGTTST